MTLSFVASRSNKQRMRIVLCVLGAALMVYGLACGAALVSEVADLFKERAALEQS